MLESENKEREKERRQKRVIMATAARKEVREDGIYREEANAQMACLGRVKVFLLLKRTIN